MTDKKYVQIYWVGKVPTNVYSNHAAWAIEEPGYHYSKEAAEKEAALLEKLDWYNVPEGCQLGYTYMVFPEMMPLNDKP